MNILLLPLTLFNHLHAFIFRKLVIKNIKKDDLVLDIGSGDKPFWRADVIVDKYLHDNQQRATGSVVYDKRKIFVEADVTNLPFRNKAFDFVFCSHLLEHVDDPAKAINEIMRVGKKGYIEVPLAIIEFLEPFPSHLWYCGIDKNKLIFQQKEKENNFFLDNVRYFGKIGFKSSLFIFWLSKYLQLSIIQYYWESKINFKVVKVKNPYSYSSEGKIKTQKKNNSAHRVFLFYNVIYFVTTALFYKKKNINLQDLLK